MTMRLWEIHNTVSLMGYPTDYDIMMGNLMTNYDTIGYPHDYEIMGDP